MVLLELLEMEALHAHILPGVTAYLLPYVLTSSGGVTDSITQTSLGPQATWKSVTCTGSA